MSKEVQVIKCGKCGKSLSEILNNKSTCDRCGTTNFIVDDFETHQINEAISHRMRYQFDEAEAIYKSVLDNTINEKTKVMCHFGRLLSYFGVVYVKDFKDNLIITITNYDPKYTSIKQTPYYDDIMNSVYAKDYEKDLEDIEKEYLRIKEELDKGKRYDIFICSKISEKTVKNPYSEGYTRDNEIAKSLHKMFNNSGIKAFYSAIDVEGGIEYDGQILSALLRSDYMLVVTTDKEYIESPWVQSEWERWLSLMSNGVKKQNTLYLTIPTDKDVLLPNKIRRVNIFDQLEVFNKISEKIKSNEKTKTVEDLITEANRALKYSKFEKVENLAEEIIEKYNDYRGWLLLVDLLKKQRINSNDFRYKDFLDNAMKMCDNKVIIQDIESKYKDYLFETNKQKDITLKDNRVEQNKNTPLEEMKKESQVAPEKLHEIGLKYYKKNQYENAIKYYELSAKQGYNKAQYSLGVCYYYGRGVAQDYKQAAYWFEQAAKQGHEQAKEKLTEIKKNLTNTPKLYLENGFSYINFGKYPQTVVADKSLIANLNTISKVNQLGYIEYNGEEYKKVVVSPYESGYTFINGNAITSDENYYFKVEPIKWRVLYNSDGTYKLLSEMILDNASFYSSSSNRTINGSTIYANNYEYSNIRAWLNGYNGTDYNVSDYTNKGFIDIAFTEEEKLLINSTLVDNSLSSTGDTTNNYICNNTTDKIYLLSYSEATNTSYGFSSSYSDYDVARQAQVSDYARSKGCYMNTSTSYLGNGYWWLRSPYSDDSSYAESVNLAGYIIDYNYSVYVTDYGTRPALEITI